MGETIQITGAVVDGDGEIVPARLIWQNETPGIGTVSSDGVVTALAEGKLSITARVAELRHIEVVPATASIQVQRAVASVEVEPAAPPLLYIGDVLQLSAQPLCAAGTPLGRAVTWNSGNPLVATVSSSGEVTAMRTGAATITAASEGRSGVVHVTVVERVAAVSIIPPELLLRQGSQLQLTAILTDGSASALEGRAVAWASSDPAIASVSAQGLVSGLAEGVAVVTASSEGQAGSSTVTVRAQAGSVTIDPVTATLLEGERITLTATVRDFDGTVVDRTVSWSSSQPAVATVGADGAVQAVAAGIAIVTATQEGVTGSAVIVVQSPVASVRVSPVAALLKSGETVQLMAVTADASGSLLQRKVTWSAADPAIATVDAGGLVTAVDEGTTTVTAASEGVTGSASITVAPAVESVEVTSLYTTVAVGGTLPLSVSTKGRGGQPVQAHVDWSSDDEAIATVGSDGVVTGVSQGVVTISAQSEGKRGSIGITVAEPVANIVISRPTGDEEDAPVMVGGTEQLTVALYGASGAVLTDRPVTWSSSNPAVATVDQAGLVLGVSQGTVSVSASSEGATTMLPLRVAGSGGGGGGGEDEGMGNNLSNPVVFAEGVGMTGLPVAEDPGLRPTPEEAIEATANPFWNEANEKDCGPNPELPIYYCQQGPNTWRAQWLEGTPGEPRSALVDWGDNLTHHQFNTHTPLRIEVTLTDQTAGDLTGYAMFWVSGDQSTEMQGTDGQTLLVPATIFSVAPRLIIEKLNNETYDQATGTGEVQEVIFDGSLADAMAEDGPGQFSAEVNVAGKVIYGFTLMIKDVVFQDATIHKYGWWRIIFQLDDAAQVGGVGYDRNVSLDALAGTDDAELLFPPRLDTESQSTWLDIYVISASGGGGGGTH